MSRRALVGTHSSRAGSRHALRAHSNFAETGRGEEVARQDLQKLRELDRITPDLVFRDPYLLDSLGLKDAFSERDLETAILRELERFLLELGTDFAFIARQKRMPIGNQDFYLDLLFYHRRLGRLIALDPANSCICQIKAGTRFQFRKVSDS